MKAMKEKNKQLQELWESERVLSLLTSILGCSPLFIEGEASKVETVEPS